MTNFSTNIEIPPFFRGVKLIIGSNDFLREQLLTINETEDIVNEISDEYISSSRTLTIHIGNGESVIFVKYPNLYPRDISTIAHEATHAALFLMRGVDIKTNKHSDELLCYLVEYITFRILQSIEEMDNKEES